MPVLNEARPIKDDDSLTACKSEFGWQPPLIVPVPQKSALCVGTALRGRQSTQVRIRHTMVFTVCDPLHITGHTLHLTEQPPVIEQKMARPDVRPLQMLASFPAGPADLSA
eukprot:358237-Chlamydomonas_euryale.AAC.6